MNENRKINPISWAIAFGIIVLCFASAISISKSCRPAKFEFFQLLKTDLGGCPRSEVMPSDPMVTSDVNPGFDTVAINNIVPGSENRESINNSADFEDNVSRESLTPIDISSIHRGEVYFLTDAIYPNSFNAPIHGHKPRWGRVAPVVGSLQANQRFRVIDKISTFSGYNWLEIEPINTSEVQNSVWVPWGARETPVIKAPNSDP